MAVHNDFGKQAESDACAFLQENGYTILARNYIFQHAEIDIIACLSDLLVVVEVKARSSVLFGNPETFVSQGKIKLLSKAINQYILETNWEGEVRFDIISVIKEEPKNQITHIEDAFYPF